ncbi:MAG TPA: hypothetical protein HA359_03340 [Candidatus Poseidoniaceae archaeon]|nr:MAG TPA: hypothetical protein D7H84_03345 [Candidatus Poseidoniales archaeon]HII23271.1 hypothetical protein [Candidatus Poseidoniaceae archaeon]
MKLYNKSISLMIVALFLGSIALTIVTESANDDLLVLPDEPQVSEAPPSPGHAVFAEYIGASWCPPCMSSASPSLNELKSEHPEEMVFISHYGYGSPTVYPPDPLNRRSHVMDGGSGIPVTKFGDTKAPSTYHVSGGGSTGTMYDTQFSTGGNMLNPNDFSLLVSQSENGNNMDIEITATYFGSSSSVNAYLQAVVTEHYGAQPYDNGNIPHNVIRDWLLNPGNNGFTQMTLTPNNPVSTSWSVPISTVRSATTDSGAPISAVDNFLTVAALMSGPHNTYNSVYAAADASMGPKLDLAVSSVSISNPAGANGYVNGDQISLSATATNVGGIDYSDGGNLEIVYMDGNTPVVVSSKQLTNLVVQGTMSHTATIDTTNLPSNAWSTGFGARLTGLIGDRSSSNSILVENFNHDRPPTAKQATVSGDNVIERGSIFTVVAKGGADDYVDTIQTMTFELEVSPAGTNAWDGSIDSGGDNIVNEGTSNEGREYTMTPKLSMPAGTYDLRSRTIDSRGQVSDWRVTPNAFSLANGIPQVTAEPVPTVICDVETNVDMTGHISDPETALYDLVVDSNSPYFISWNPLSTTITVKFTFDEVQGCPLGQKSILVTVDDGADYGNDDNLPYGTLKFNVIENGQPRWLGLPTQTIDEQGPDSDGTLRLQPYVSDTTSDGQPSSTSLLSFDIVGESNPGIIYSQIINGVLGFETIGTDAEGQTTLTIRACDADMECSDQTVLININPINDAPVIDMSPFEGLRIKTGEESTIDLDSLVSDVDNADSEVTVIVSSPDEAGGAQFNRQTGMLKLKFNEVGDKNIVIKVVDTYSSNEYVATVEVYDSDEFTIAMSPIEEGFMIVEMSNVYIGQMPYINMYLSDDAPVFSSLSVRWQTCSNEGVCDGIWFYDLDMTQSASGWEGVLDIPNAGDPTKSSRPFGYDYGDYFYLMIDGVDSLNNNYKTPRAVEPLYKWTVTQDMPSPSQMDVQMLEQHIDNLNSKIDNLKEQISANPDADNSELELELIDAEFELELACLDTRVVCTKDDTSGTNIDDSNSEYNSILIIGIVVGIIFVALLGGMFLLRGREIDDVHGFKWADTTLPARDAVANSMYGGTQQIFQQPLQNSQYAPNYQQPIQTPQYAQPAPPLNIPPLQAHRGPPLPPGGLPAGWSMDQWEYYGQQYLDRLQG